MKAVFEVPGYPYEDQMAEDHDYPPTSLLYAMKELTIEITHTEMIDGFEYFVFNRADYDWPPVPNLFWAGQKVRLSDEGVLLLHWNGQDIPLYDFNPHHPNDYSISEYPLLKNENKPVKVDIRRRIWEESKNPYDVLNPPANLGQVFMALYKVRYPEFHILNFYDQIDDHTGTMFVTGYGLATYETFYPGFDASVNFMNRIAPISAIISGEKVLYEQTGGPNFTFFSMFGHWSLLSDFINGSSSVQSISWGQVKRYR